jgi:hypothetical protein
LIFPFWSCLLVSYYRSPGDSRCHWFSFFMDFVLAARCFWAQIWIFLESLCLTPVSANEALLFSGAESCGPVTGLVRLSFSRWATSICCWAATCVSCSCLSRSARFSGASVVVAHFRHGVFIHQSQQGLSSGFFEAPVGPTLSPLCLSIFFAAAVSGSRLVAPVTDFTSSVLRGGFSSCYSIQREHEPTRPVCEFKF